MIRECIEIRGVSVSPRDMRLRIPGFRRYGAELERLRGQDAALEVMRQQLDKAALVSRRPWQAWASRSRR